MTRSKVVRPSRQTLVLLKAEIDAARADLARSRALDGLERPRLVDAQRRLLIALDRYVSALRAAGCAPHWQLTSEADLLRAVIEGDGPYRTACRH